MRDLLSWSLEKARHQTLTLVEDLREEQMCLQTASGENNPAWILGHLLLGDIYLLSMLKVQGLTEDFSDLLNKYGSHSNPTSAIEHYDSKQTLVERLKYSGLLRLDSIQKMKREDFEQPTPDKTLARAQPTIEHHLFALAIHEGHHGGQLSAWRKLQGLSSVKWTFGAG